MSLPSGDYSVEDRRHHNVTENHGNFMDAHGAGIVQTLHVYNNQKDIISDMPRSKHAEFDMNKEVQRGACAPETRLAVLEYLLAWTKDPNSPLIFWLSGILGTGKTTIAYTLCERLRERGVLGASFFCSSTQPDCQDVHLIFPTIAFQLARDSPAFSRRLAEVLRRDPDIHNRSLEEQLRKLILEPLRGVEPKYTPTSLVIVIDALDECNRYHTQFLDSLFQHEGQLPFKILLTSRPDHTINKFMSTEQATSHSRVYALHEVKKAIVDEDIANYLRRELFSLSPPTSTIDLLVDKSGGLFVYAATLAHFIMDKRGDKKRRLEQSIAWSQSGNISSITRELNKLYVNILSRVFNPEGDEISMEDDRILSQEREDLKNVLYTVVYAREPLTRRSIAGLWELDESTVDTRLDLLCSFISVPSDNSTPIMPFHASFREFLSDESRSGLYYCDENHFHGEFAFRCFKTMNKLLRRNICQINGELFLPYSSINTNADNTDIPPALAYACVHGTSHLKSCSQPIPPLLKDEATAFVTEHVFHWLEYLSILQHLAMATVSLDNFGSVFKENNDFRTRCRELRRFVQANYNIISQFCLHTYLSAPIWVPLRSPLRSHYPDLWEQPEIPRVLRGLPSSWTGPEQIIPVNSGEIHSITVSRAGDRIVTGSSEGALSVWDVNSHAQECKLSGHSPGFLAVTISPDGTWAASASQDESVRIWNLASQEIGFVFGKNLGLQYCVSISPDGLLICSGGEDKCVRVWDSKTGNMKGVFEGHSLSISSIAFTPDSKSVISGSYDRTIRTWDIGSQKCVQILQGHKHGIATMAISPTDGSILTTSFDRTIRVWTLQKGNDRLIYNGPQHMCSLSWFPDGKRAASGSSDNTIYIWNIALGTQLMTWNGDGGAVSSIAVFPDGRRIASCSASTRDTVSIWAIPEADEAPYLGETGILQSFWNYWIVNRGKEVQPKRDKVLVKGRIQCITSVLLCILQYESILLLNPSNLEKCISFKSGAVERVGLSPQAKYLAAAFSQMIRLWHVKNRGRSILLEGHQGIISCLVFSPNEEHLISCSKDKTVRIWSTEAGTQNHVLDHSDEVLSIAFSTNPKQLVSGSKDGTARVWNVETGALQRLLKQDGSIVEVAFFDNNQQVITHAKGRTWAMDVDHIYKWNIGTGRLVAQPKKNCVPLAALFGTVVYAYHKSGWLHRFTSPTQSPEPVCWIPPQHRLNPSSLDYVRMRSVSVSNWDFVDFGDEDATESIVLRIPRK